MVLNGNQIAMHTEIPVYNKLAPYPLNFLSLCPQNLASDTAIAYMPNAQLFAMVLHDPKMGGK